MAFENLPDHLLIEKCQEGNPKAFDILFSRYFGKLYKYTCFHTNDPLLAEELVMDLMLWLWHKKDTLEVKGDLSSYLFRAIKNAIFNHFRKKALSTTPLDLLPIDAVAHQSADDNNVTKEIDLQYKLSLAQLTPQRRKVFQLSREEDMTYPEIATHLNLSVKTVEAHVSASLQLMRKCFKDYADFISLIIFIQFFL